MSLQLISEKEIHAFTRSRVGEKKIGDTISFVRSNDWESELSQFSGKYCILGIPEDIGPYANLGKRGAAGGFKDFLSYFLNMQDNSFLSGSELLLLGQIELEDLQLRSEKLKNTNLKQLEELRALVEEIDNRVFPVVKAIVAAGKIPIVIGGGHNNSYPVIKGSSLGSKKKPIAVVNIDPHADIRALEGRHSGNGFSYAIADGYLEKYHPIGLHENYNNSYTWDKLNSDKDLFRYCTLDELLLKDLSTKDVVNKALKFMKGMPIGIEIDMDSIKYTESSARTPVGLSESKVRKLLHLLARDKNIVYLNLSEGIPDTTAQTGKLQAYLVADFIRAKA